jgi:hypothetical protein
MSSWGFTNDFNSLFGFLGLGLGLGLNKMDLAYVCMFRILYKILYYT